MEKTFWSIWVAVTLLLVGTWTTNLEITEGLVNKLLIYIFLTGLVTFLTRRKQWTPFRRFVNRR